MGDVSNERGPERRRGPSVTSCFLSPVSCLLQVAYLATCTRALCAFQSGPLNYHRRPLPDPDAHRTERASRSGRLELSRRRQDQPGARHA